MRAAEMFGRGRRQVDVAAELGVSAQTASRWYRAWRERGRDGLAGAGRAGRRRKLTDEQLAGVEAALLAGGRGGGGAAPEWGPCPGGAPSAGGARGRRAPHPTTTAVPGGAG